MSWKEEQERKSGRVSRHKAEVDKHKRLHDAFWGKLVVKPRKEKGEKSADADV